MTENKQLVVEVRFAHLHAIGRDLDVLPEVWSDALYELLPDGPHESVHADVDSARKVARSLRDVAGIPSEDIRIRLVAQKILPIEESDHDDAGAAIGSERRLYQWRSEALRNYAPGYAFAVGSSVDEAKSAAMMSFKAHLASDGWWGGAPDSEGNFLCEEDREDYEAKIAAFERDLSEDPLAVGEAFVVRGSD